MATPNGPAPASPQPRVILRRRSGDVVERITHNENGTSRHFVLGTDAPEATPRARLMMACENILETLRSGKDVVVSMRRLYPEQETVLEDAAKYFEYCANFVSSKQQGRLEPGRIEMPPGCGKTVVAGKIVAATGATVLYVTPRTTLAEQAATELSKQLPNVPIGVYTGDRKELVDGGITITTNAMMYGWLRSGDAPRQVREATVVFFDEGHMMLTALAVRVLHGLVGENAVCIGLSGSPHYSEKKTMALVFPRLIHRIDFPEALALGLIAKPKCGVYEVDVDGSQVRVVAGNYDPKTLERIERQAPFFQAALDLRYDPGNIGNKSIIVCRTRQQAYDCQRFFAAHRPPGTPLPAYVVSGMSDDERRKNLKDFESGRIDTLINVKVLTLGWDHPPCKVMVDLAFTLSYVDAIQKWLRITRLWKNAAGEAVVPRLYMLLPTGLNELPILPSDLFGMDVETDSERFLELEERKVIRKAKTARLPKLERRRRTVVAEVKASVRKLMDIELALPTLERTNDEQIRAVLLCNEAFGADKVPPRSVFRELTFVHPYFSGSGTQLLRYLQIGQDPAKYARTMVRLFPYAASAYLVRLATESQGHDEYARLMLRRHGLKASAKRLRQVAEEAAEQEFGCDIDLAVLEAETRRQLSRQGKGKERVRVSQDVENAWHMFGERDDVATPEEEAHWQDVVQMIDDELDGTSEAELELEVRFKRCEAAVRPVLDQLDELEARMKAEEGMGKSRGYWREIESIRAANRWQLNPYKDTAREYEAHLFRRRVLKHAYGLAEQGVDVKAFVSSLYSGELPENFKYNPKYMEMLGRAQEWLRNRLRENLFKRSPRAKDRYDFSCVLDLFWP